MCPREYLVGTPSQVGSFSARPARRPFTIFGDPVLEGRSGDAYGIRIAGRFRGSLADVDAVRRLVPLPETADEPRAIAAGLKGGEAFP